MKKGNAYFHNNSQIATKRVLGQDFSDGHLMISICSKTMHILSLSSGIPPGTKVSMRNQEVNSNL